MSELSLSLLGEPLAVELANTIMGDGIDLLDTELEARHWLQAHRAQLPAGALHDPPDLGALHELRGAIRELLAAAMEDRRPTADAVRIVNDASAAGSPALALSWGRHGPAVNQVPGSEGAAAATIATLARSAITLLGGPDRARLRCCSAPECTMRFVATNPRRLWCSAETCGNRVRVARHYARHHHGG